MKKSAQVPVTKEQDAAWTGTAPTREAPSNQNKDNGNYRDAGAVAGALAGVGVGGAAQVLDNPAANAARVSKYDRQVLDQAAKIDSMLRENPALAASLDAVDLDKLYEQTGNSAFSAKIPKDYLLSDPSARFEALRSAVSAVDPEHAIRIPVKYDNGELELLRQNANAAEQAYTAAESSAADAKRQHIDPLEDVVAQATEELKRRENGLIAANAEKKMHADDVSAALADEQAASRHRAELQRQLNAAEKARVEAERTLARRRSDPIATRNRDAAINEATRLRGEISAADSAIADARSRVAPFNAAIADARDARTIAEGALEAAKADLSNARLTHEAPYTARLDRAGEVRDAANRGVAEFENARAHRLAEMLMNPDVSKITGEPAVHYFDPAIVASKGFTPEDVRALAAVAKEDPMVYAELKKMLTESSRGAVGSNIGTVPPDAASKLTRGFTAAEELVKLLNDNPASLKPDYLGTGKGPAYGFDFSVVDPKKGLSGFDAAAYKEMMDFIESDNYRAMTGGDPPELSADKRLNEDFNKIQRRFDNVLKKRQKAEDRATAYGGKREFSELDGKPLLKDTGLPVRKIDTVKADSPWVTSKKIARRFGLWPLIGAFGGSLAGSQISTPASVDAAGGNTNDYRKH